MFTDSKPHYLLLDGLRGVAAFIVIMYHVFECFDFIGDEKSRGKFVRFGKKALPLLAETHKNQLCYAQTLPFLPFAGLLHDCFHGFSSRYSHTLEPHHRGGEPWR